MAAMKKEMREKVVALVAEGKTASEISEVVGVKVSEKLVARIKGGDGASVAKKSAADMIDTAFKTMFADRARLSKEIAERQIDLDKIDALLARYNVQDQVAA